MYNVTTATTPEQAAAIIALNDAREAMAQMANDYGISYANDSRYSKAAKEAKAHALAIGAIRF